MRRVLVGLLITASLAISSPAGAAPRDTNCRFACPGGPDVRPGAGTLTATYFEVRTGTGYASNSPPSPPSYHWRMRTQCAITDPNVGGCDPNAITCPQPPNRVVSYYLVQS